MDDILNQANKTNIRSMVMSEEGLIVDYGRNQRIIVKPTEKLEIYIPGHNYWLKIEAIPLATNDEFPDTIGE